jgi:hypothetical protein
MNISRSSMAQVSFHGIGKVSFAKPSDLSPVYPV